MVDEKYKTVVHSFTKDIDYVLIVSKKYIQKEDKILFVDDFMANGEAALGAIRIIKEAGADLVGIGIVIEKSFQPGRKKIEELGYDVCSLARVASLKDGKATFVQE